MFGKFPSLSSNSYSVNGIKQKKMDKLKALITTVSFSNRIQSQYLISMKKLNTNVLNYIPVFS